MNNINTFQKFDVITKPQRTNDKNTQNTTKNNIKSDLRGSHKTLIIDSLILLGGSTIGAAIGPINENIKHQKSTKNVFFKTVDDILYCLEKDFQEDTVEDLKTLFPNGEIDFSKNINERNIEINKLKKAVAKGKKEYLEANIYPNMKKLGLIGGGLGLLASLGVIYLKNLKKSKENTDEINK